MEEVWKDIEGYEKLYQVSNFGNVKSLDRIRKQYNHNGIATVKYKGKILKKQIKKGTGYYTVTLYDNNRKAKIKSIHRLVAETFIPNPSNLLEVNHKDGNKQNNNVNNLEWCSRSQNVKHAYTLGLAKNRRLYGRNNPKATRIEQYDLENNFIKLWYSIIEASKELNIESSSISAVCKNKRKTAGGYTWKYERR